MFAPLRQQTYSVVLSGADVDLGLAYVLEAASCELNGRGLPALGARKAPRELTLGLHAVGQKWEMHSPQTC